jgi:glycosyltransferase involved in cell wall biosynthesis
MENGIVNISNGLDSSDYVTDVFCLERPGTFAPRLPHDSRLVVHGKPPGFSPGAVFGLRQAVLVTGADIVHSHNLGPLIYSVLATYLGRQCPIVHGEHSELVPDELRGKRRLQRKLGYRFCACLHTVSAESQRQISGLCSAPKVRSIPNGVDTKRFRPRSRLESRAAAGLPENALVLGIVGRFGALKGHTVLIAAFTQFAAVNPKLHLLIVGSGGPAELETRELARSSPYSERIKFTGFQERPEELYPAMDLLVVPSMNEGMSNATLEAMASGVPVLSHESCGAREIITPGIDGWIGNCATIEGLSGCLAEVLSCSERHSGMGEAARAKAVESFSIERMVRSYAGLYREVALSRGNRLEAPRRAGST